MNNDKTIGRGPHSPHAGDAGGQSAALLVDFDNVTLGIRSELQQQLKSIMNSDVFRGKISVHRAYADWRRYPQYIVPLSEASFDLIFAPAFGASKKNATDIRLAIDAVELVFVRPEIGTYILLSGDSDFSSLVLKLKEYGKYVIGIGIIESASDLLIQNCDEYYSYSELTGFTRVSDEDEAPSRDPWGLVVEAMVRMKERGDVMRSDRLKQVMQELDTHFTEKNAGFNKFSRFVIESAKRGLLTATKLQNGQYELDLGRVANVDPGMAATQPDDNNASTATRRTASPHPLNLSEAFDALKAVLRATPGEGGDAVDSDTVRERLIETAGANPVFTGQRYNRLLRQAHDAELIELVKSGDGYVLRLAERFRGAEPAASAVKATKTRTRKKARPAAPKDTAGEADAEAAPKRPRTRAKKKVTKEEPAAELDAGPAEAESAEDQKNPVEDAVAPPPREQPAASTRRGSRGMGPRSRGRSPRAPAASGGDVKATSARDEPQQKESRHEESVRPASRKQASPQRPPPTDEPARPATDRPAPELAQPRRSGPGVEGPRAEPTRSETPSTPVAEPAPKPPREESGDDGGFLKRVSAVVQKALRGETDADD